jgi:agmatine deiminase
MPSEREPHERTLMAFPTASRRDQLWGELLDDARSVYADIASTLAGFEPVTMVVDPDDEHAARRHCSAAVDLLVLPIDDAWMRDSGPVVLCAASGDRVAVHFRFNAWGRKYHPFERDAAVGRELAAALALPCYEAPFVLEGGAIAIDGGGTLVATERSVLHPNRNPGCSQAEMERALQNWLGVRRVVWLADGIAEDAGTDGHVDNVVAFAGAGRALVQGCDDPENPNRAIARDNVRRLVATGIECVELPVLPYVAVGGARRPVPYANLYVANGAVLVPVVGHDADREALVTVGECFPGREIVPVPGAVLAHGGGGVHCITQQVPAPLGAGSSA